MKQILSILFSIVLINSCFGQTKNKKPIPLFYSICEPSKLEYVIFCGVKLKVPRPKNPTSSINCCQGDSSASKTNLGCDNDLIIWTTYANEKALKLAFEKNISGYFTNKGIVHVKKEPVVCYLWNKRVNGYKLQLKLNGVKTTVGSDKQVKTTMIQNILTAYSVINGQPVIVELYSNKLNNNNDIANPIRQILHF